MKKLAVTISAALLLANPVSAQFYLGAKAGTSWMDDFCHSDTVSCDKESWSAGAFAGYELSEYISFELGVDSLGETSGAGFVDEVAFVYSLSPKFSLPMSDEFSFFAKLGAAYATYGDESDHSMLGALGATYSILPTVDLQLEIMRLTSVEIGQYEIAGNAGTIGILKRFGGSNEQTAEPFEEVMVEQRVTEEIEKVEEVVASVPQTKKYAATLDYGHFAFDSAELNPEFITTLVELEQFMKKYPQTVVYITGHTDSKGSDEYNQKLSERRAKSVSDMIIKNGIDSSRVVQTGKGEKSPIATNDTDEGRAQNRRVEISIPEFEYSE